MKMTTLIAAAIAAVSFACAPAPAQKVSTLPGAQALTGSEKIVAAQGVGCATGSSPCATVTATPAQIALYLAPQFQARSANLNALSAVTTAADLCGYWTGSAAASMYACPSWGRGLVGAGSAGAAQAYLGVSATGTDPAFAKLTGATFTGPLEVYRTSGNATLSLTAPTAGTASASIDFKRTGGLAIAGISAESEIGDDYGHLRFFTRGASDGMQERARLDSGGYLGLGTTSPQTRLDVAGNTTLRGTLAVTGAVSAQSLALATPLPVSSGGTGDGGGAWATYTPAIVCGSGTLSSASATGRYKKIGKTVFITITVSISSNGNCSNFVSATLPSASGPASNIISGAERGVSGKLLQGVISAGANRAEVFAYDNSYPGADGASLTITGVYESN